MIHTSHARAGNPFGVRQGEGARMRPPRSRQRGLAYAAVAVTAFALVASGCGGSSSGGGGGNKPKAAANEFNAGVTGVRNVSSKKGGTLNLIADADCDYYDPARTYYGHCWDMQRLFSRSLMGYKAVPGSGGLDVVPDLAASAGTTIDGGKTWTYKIRPGLKFEDGS